MEKTAQLEAENQALRQLLQTLSNDAAHNETVMQRFQERELALLSAQDLPKLLERLTTGLRASFALEDVHLVLLDPFGVIVELLNGLGIRPEDMRHLSIVKDVKNTLSEYPDLHKPWLGSYQRSSHAKKFNALGISCVALLPLRQPDGLSGFLHLGSRNPERFRSERGTDFLQRLARISALCLENSVNRERLRLTGLTDGLTGLYNRRHLEKRLDEEITRACRHHHPLSCLFIDADHFKKINDEYGHSAGDQVLIALAKRIREQLRASDLATRYGGEEIVVLLPQTDLRNALLLAERIRLAIAQTPIVVAETKAIEASVSIGVAQLGANCNESPLILAQQLLHAADRQVYHAKESGRNCVKSA